LGYLDELFRYAMVLTRNQTDAEDLVQETKSDRLRRLCRVGAAVFGGQESVCGRKVIG
jgi:hypothetical protein